MPTSAAQARYAVMCDIDNYFLIISTIVPLYDRTFNGYVTSHLQKYKVYTPINQLTVNSSCSVCIDFGPIS